MAMYKDFKSYGDPIHRVVAHLVVWNDEGGILSNGTGVFISHDLVLTAKHVAEDMRDKFINKNTNTLNGSLRVAKILDSNPPSYAMREGIEIIMSPITDVAFLRVKPYNKESFSSTERVSIDLSIPKTGTEVVGFGFHGPLGHATITKDADGGNHIVINNKPKVTQGHIQEMIDFDRMGTPAGGAFYAFFQTAGGMSGGPVFNNKTGHVIGIIQSGFEPSEEHEPLSKICLLWPSLLTYYSLEDKITILDLIKKGDIKAHGLDKIGIYRNDVTGELTIKISKK